MAVVRGCAAVVLVAAVAVTATASPAPAGADRCARKAGRTVKETTAVRVYRIDGRTYACLRERGRGWHLGDVLDDISSSAVGQLRIAGRYVAYEIGHYYKNDVEYFVRVLDARSGRRVAEDPAVSMIGPLEPYVTRYTGVQRLILKTNASVAWLAGDAYSYPRRYEVARHDSRGYRLLDGSPDIDRRSLRLSDGGTIEWKRAGEYQRARLR